MPYATIREIKDEVLTELSMLGGADTQYYAEDKLRSTIRKRFNVFFLMRFWDEHTGAPFSVNLDVATGMPTDDMSDASRVPTGDFRDIQWVSRSNETKPLGRVPLSFNQNYVRRHGLVHVADRTKLFKVLPVGDSTAIVRARRHTVTWTDDTSEVPFDQDAMVAGVAFDFINGLGTNPSEEDKLLNQLNQRLNQLISAEDQYEHYAGSSGSSYQSEWQEVN